MSSIVEKLTDLNSLILSGKAIEAFEKYYHDEVVMQENNQSPTVGKKANHQRELEFFAALPNSGCSGSTSCYRRKYILRNWHYDYTHKDWGERNYTQVSVQHWKDGKIVKSSSFMAINEKWMVNCELWMVNIHNSQLTINVRIVSRLHKPGSPGFPLLLVVDIVDIRKSDYISSTTFNPPRFNWRPPIMEKSPFLKASFPFCKSVWCWSIRIPYCGLLQRKWILQDDNSAKEEYSGNSAFLSHHCALRINILELITCAVIGLVPQNSGWMPRCLLKLISAKAQRCIQIKIPGWRTCRQP